MANIHRGEVTVSVAGRAYTLRPTFHILCQLEERIGLTLPQLLERLASKGLLASEILMILAVATCHDGSRRFDSEAVMDMPAAKVDLQAVLPAIARFLVGALGGTSSKTGEGGGAAPAALDYALLLEAAYKVLRLEPAAFWQLTMPEFRLLLRAARPKRQASIEPQEVRALAARYPDNAPKQASFHF